MKLTSLFLLFAGSALPRLTLAAPHPHLNTGVLPRSPEEVGAAIRGSYIVVLKQDVSNQVISAFRQNPKVQKAFTVGDFHAYETELDATALEKMKMSPEVA